MSAASLLSDADLHGLVDGHIDPDRRAEVLRRAASSPRDRALIEDWQDQNDLIRAAFAEVEREPLPRALDLRTPPRLRAVPPASIALARTAKPARWRGMAVSAATVAAVSIGLAGSWYVSSLPADDMRTPVARTLEVERMLADRTAASLAFGEPDAFVAAAFAEPPPTTAIPDLSYFGFTFTGAEARSVLPRSVIFRYRNAADERVAIGATRATGGDSVPTPRDNGYIWRSRHIAYAIFGTVASERLHSIAASLDNATGPQ